ncbi:MAG TPA: DMT family transporter [Ktedonobacterales bacterium]|nr:DMT family transporter [Ktedonobacterales bacterium]
MNIGSGIAFGLVAALCWGVADFCARGSSRSGGTFLTLFYVEIIATLGMLLVNLPLGLISFAHATLGMVALAVVINLAILVGATLLYRAFAIGTLSIVSPVAASFAALTALLSLLTGERAHAPQLLGIALTVAGVTLASTVPSSAASGGAETHEAKAATTARGHRGLAPGLVEALSAMVVFGVCYWALRYPVAALGGVTVVFISKVADMVVMLLIAGAGLALYRMRTRGKPDTQENSAPWYVIHKPAPSFWLWVIGVALLDTAANVAYNLGITISLTAVVSVISSLFSAVTVLLAWVFLRERLARWQWAGVAAILVGIALVSV